MSAAAASTPQRLRRVSKFTYVQIGGFLLVMLAIYLQSYNGRAEVVGSSREGCERGALNLVATVNILRADQIGNAAIAADPRGSKVTRAVRRKESNTESASLMTLDSHIDRGVWAMLNDPRDRANVHYGVILHTSAGARRLPPFRCELAYPNTSPFLLVR